MTCESQTSKFRNRVSCGNMINKQQASQPTAEDKPLADSAAHDGHVMQGFADHTAVIRYGSRRKTCYFRHVNKNT